LQFVCRIAALGAAAPPRQEGKESLMKSAERRQNHCATSCLFFKRIGRIAHGSCIEYHGMPMVIYAFNRTRETS